MVRQRRRMAAGTVWVARTEDLAVLLNGIADYYSLGRPADALALDERGRADPPAPSLGKCPWT